MHAAHFCLTKYAWKLCRKTCIIMHGELVTSTCRVWTVD